MNRLLFNAGEWTILCLGLMILPASGICQQEGAGPATVQHRKGIYCENSSGEMVCTRDGKSLSSSMKAGLSAPAPPPPARPPADTRVAPTPSEAYPPTPVAPPPALAASVTYSAPPVNTGPPMPIPVTVAPLASDSHIAPQPANDRLPTPVPVAPAPLASNTHLAQPQPDGAESKRDAGAVLSADANQPLTPGEFVMAVQVNGHPVEDFAHLYRDAKGGWHATADLLAQTRLIKPTGQAVRVDGAEYYPLDSYRGVSYRFDTAQQLLDISFPAENFEMLNLQLSKRIPAVPMASDPGLFLNHDLQVTGSNAQIQVSGMEEFGFFSKLGVLTSQFAARDLVSHLAATRLSTQFFRDFPRKMATLNVGDSYSASFASWAQTVQYAGFSWTSKFSTQPAFLPFALPSIGGSAARPSTVDLYVNSLQMLHQPVDQGPFTISDIPVVSAMGNIQMVVTDLLGRQQVVSLPYISTRQLLRTGVSEYAYESGVQRHNFGQSSNSYGTWFASGTYRHGLSNTFTLGLRGEALLGSQTFGVGFDGGLLRVGVITGGIAVSHDKDGHVAGLAYAQLQHSARSFNFSLYAQAAQENFRQLGLLPTQRPTQFLGQAQISYMFGKWISVSAGAMHQEKPGNAVFDLHGARVRRFNTVTPSLTIRLPHGAMLMMSGNYTPEFKQRASAIMSLIIPLAKRRMVMANTGYQTGGTNPSVEYSQGLPAGTGWGYRLRTSSNNNLETPRVDAGVSYQNGLGTYQLEAAQQKSSPTTWSFNYTGGAVLLHRDALLSRSLTDGFAVVDTNGARGVKVLANNNYVAKTDRRGLAIVPSLPAYNRNSISLDETSVPLDLNVDLSERIVVPMARSGLLVKFKAEQVRGALLVLVTEDGKEVPLGAEVTVNGGKDVYEVALHGEAYIPEIQFPANIRVHWDDVSCQATVAPPGSREPLPRIGPIPCRRVR